MGFQILEKVVYDSSDKRREVGDYGDKIVLPEKILHVLIELQKREDIEKLPHPLVFRLSTPFKSTFVGVREFHGYESDGDGEDSVFLPKDVVDRLEVGNDDGIVQLSVELALGVSGFDDVKEASIELKPVEEYDDVRDWKSFLESTLSRNYTAITTGDIVKFKIGSKTYALEVVKVKTSNSMRTVCVVDRDIDLEIIGESRNEIIRDLFHDKHGRVDSGKVVKISIGDGETIECNGSFALGDEFVGSDRFECASIGEIATCFGDRHLYAFEDLEFKIVPLVSEVSTDGVACRYCDQRVSEMSLMMHESFCQRNRVVCDECGTVFNGGIPSEHWHCCNKHGDDKVGFDRHVSYFHEQCICLCGTTFDRKYDMCVHVSRECTSSLHECRFCHLIVSRGEESVESRYHDMSGHEWTCGSKTTQCFKCGKIVKVRDVRIHDEWHAIDLVANGRAGCVNVLCSNLSDDGNDEGLCVSCFSPLYSTVNDPDGSKLRGRVERRYILMMKNGCGDNGCDNELCDVGGSMGDIVKRVKGMEVGKYQFCVDRKNREKMRLVRMFDGSGWTKGWIIEAMKNVNNDINGVLPWLESNVVIN